MDNYKFGNKLFETTIPTDIGEANLVYEPKEQL